MHSTCLPPYSEQYQFDLPNILYNFFFFQVFFFLSKKLTDNYYLFFQLFIFFFLPREALVCPLLFRQEVKTKKEAKFDKARILYHII